MNETQDLFVSARILDLLAASLGAMDEHVDGGVTFEGKVTVYDELGEPVVFTVINEDGEHFARVQA